MAIPSKYKESITPLAIKFQRAFSFFPKRICLISGAPRSGTTALCEWLGHQEGVSAIPESRILVSVHRFMEEVQRFRNLEKDSQLIFGMARGLVYDYYSSSRILMTKSLLVDKEPLEPIAFPSKGYEQFIVNTRLLFPEAKILLAIRDPLSTIWSMQARTWGESLTSAGARRFTLEEYAENWSSCAELVARHQFEPNTYIVQFGRLVNDPMNESKRIFDFLHIRNGIPFQPRPTHSVGFTKEDQANILRIIKPQLELLASKGLSEL